MIEDGAKKRVAIVTGASGGIGVEFVRLLALREDVDELWAVARNAEKLDGLRARFGGKVIGIPHDLSLPEGCGALCEKLKREQPVLAYLVNNAGVARMGDSQGFPPGETEATIALNCTAMVLLCNGCLPYMRSESRIINVSSASAFQPVPYLNLYAATKAFELSYSRALNAELRGTGVTVTAVCPSWVDTDLLVRELNGRRIEFHGLAAPGEIAKTALDDAVRGKDISVHPGYAKYLHVLARVLPHKAVMALWLRELKRYSTECA